MLRKRPRNRKKGLLIFIIGIFLVFFIFLLIFKTKLFTITNLEVVGKDLACINKQQLIDSTKIIGKNFFLADTDKKDIKGKFICIKDVVVSKAFPNKVKLEAIPRQAVATLTSLQVMEASSEAFLEGIATPSAAIQDEGYVIDEEGIVFSKSDPSFQGPNIYIYNQELSIGKKFPNSEPEKILKILKKLDQFGIEKGLSLLLDNYFIIYTKPRINFRLDKGIDTQLASLQLILEKAKIDSEQLEFVDLRFDKPIISIAPKKHG